MIDNDKITLRGKAGIACGVLALWVFIYLLPNVLSDANKPRESREKKWEVLKNKSDTHKVMIEKYQKCRKNKRNTHESCSVFMINDAHINEMKKSEIKTVYLDLNQLRKKLYEN